MKEKGLYYNIAQKILKLEASENHLSVTLGPIWLQIPLHQGLLTTRP